MPTKAENLRRVAVTLTINPLSPFSIATLLSPVSALAPRSSGLHEPPRTTLPQVIPGLHPQSILVFRSGVNRLPRTDEQKVGTEHV